jgi:hypothetical protein
MAGDVAGAQNDPLANFFAFDAEQRGGVRLAVKDADGDARADLLAGSGEGQRGVVHVYLGASLAATPANDPRTPDTVLRPFAPNPLNPDPGPVLPQGVFVG